MEANSFRKSSTVDYSKIVIIIRNSVYKIQKARRLSLPGFSVEMAGVEPASKQAAIVLSTSLVFS